MLSFAKPQLWWRVLFLTVLSWFAFFSWNTAVFAQEVVPTGYSSCLQTAFTARGDGVTSAEFQSTVTGIGGDVAAWSCQRVCLPADQTSSGCVVRGCPSDGPTVLCCKPGIGSPPTAQNRCAAPASGGTAGSGSTGGTSGGRFTATFQLPACTKTGNCGLGDIVNTGVRFANFLLGLAGFIFFATFLFAGVRLLFFAYDAKSVGQAKATLEKAVIGITIMIVAGTIVRFVFSSFQANVDAGTGAAATAITGSATKTPSNPTP